MIRKMKSICIFFIICCLAISGCGNKIEQSKYSEEKEEKIQIGICFDSFLIERWERDRDVFVSFL